MEGAAISDRCIVSAEALDRGATLVLGRRIVLVLRSRQLAGDLPVTGAQLIGGSDEILDLRRRIDQVSDLDVTGAVRDHRGHFERAGGGTLFLDEVADTPPDVQAMLLRALETRTILPVGGRGPWEVDVRLLAATDADLTAAVETGRFRLPLLHRLSGYEILVPPLRRRREDIGRLNVHFLREELPLIVAEDRLDGACEAYMIDP